MIWGALVMHLKATARGLDHYLETVMIPSAVYLS